MNRRLKNQSNLTEINKRCEDCTTTPKAVLLNRRKDSFIKLLWMLPTLNLIWAIVPIPSEK